MPYQKPPLNILQDFIRTYEKRVGLRKLYADYGVPIGERHKYREIWTKLYELMPDAYEKIGKVNYDAFEDGEAETLDGDSGTSAGEAVPEESWSSENDEEEIA